MGASKMILYLHNSLYNDRISKSNFIFNFHMKLLGK